MTLLLKSYLLTLSAQYLIPTLLLLTTPKSSLYRYLSLPCIIYLASQPIAPEAGTSPTRCMAVAMSIVAAVQATNLLLLNPLDDNDLRHENLNPSPSPRRTLCLADRLWTAFKALSQIRAVNTPRQVKNVPPQPVYYSYSHSHSCARGEKSVAPRGIFLKRQIAIFVWQFLVCDVLQSLARQRDGSQAGFEHINWFIPFDRWVGRAIENLLTWFAVARLLIDAHYRLASVVFVGSGLDVPSNWPPAFGRMRVAYTIRNFWGKFWHQFLRQPFTAVSNFFTRDLLHLPRQSILERYTNIFIVFLLSAVLHTAIDFAQAIPLEYSGSRAFFLSMVPGIMVEDGVQALWRRMWPGTEDGKSSLSLSSSSAGTVSWKRVVGLVWVMGWLGVTSTWYFHPMSQLSPAATTFVPFSVVERVGMESVSVALLVYGVVLCLLFGIEV